MTARGGHGLAAIGGEEALAAEIARAALALAQRLRDGGTLYAFGSGASATDAQHVAVEFVHPVGVGKPALPAVSLTSEAPILTGDLDAAGAASLFAAQLCRLARPGDAAIGIGGGAAVRAALAAARERGLLRIALGDAEPGAVDHRLLAPAADALVAKEFHVAFYHLLWEGVHVCLDALDGGPLHPFGDARPLDLAALLAELARSSALKLRETAALRERSLRLHARTLADGADAVARALDRGGRLLAFGNGGSSTDAQAVAELFARPPFGPPAPARSLVGDVAVVTALANDVGFEVVFARQVAAFGRTGDVALGFSTSGDSANVLRGLAEARARGLVTLGFAGYAGGRMLEEKAVDFPFVVPCDSIHRIQESQTTLAHALFERTQRCRTRAQEPACAS